MGRRGGVRAGPNFPNLKEEIVRTELRATSICTATLALCRNFNRKRMKVCKVSGGEYDGNPRFGTPTPTNGGGVVS